MDDIEIILSCFHKTAYKNVKDKIEYECTICTTTTTNIPEWLKTPGNQVLLKQIEYDFEILKFEKLKKDLDILFGDADFHALMSLEKCMNELYYRREKILIEFTKKLNEHYDELREKIQQQFCYKITKFDENIKKIEKFETNFSTENLKHIQDLQQKNDKFKNLISNIKQKNEFISSTISDLTNEKIKLVYKEYEFDMKEIFGYLVDKYSIHNYRLFNILRGHTASVSSLELFKPDQFLSASQDRTIKFWSKSQCISTFEGHTSSVNCIAKLNSSQFVSGSCDYSLKVWNINTRECLYTLKGHKGSVLCLKLLKNGFVLSGSIDMTIKKWDIENGVCQNTFKGHQRPVRCLDETMDYKIVSGSEDGTIKIWDQNGMCLKILNGHQSGIFCLVAISENYLASGSEDKTIKLWNIQKGCCFKTLKEHTSIVTSIKIFKKIISSSADGTIKIWDLNTGSSLKTIKATDFSVNSIAINQDGDIFCGISDKDIKIWSKY